MTFNFTIEIFNIYINPITSLIGSFFCLSMYIFLRNSIFGQSFFFHLRVESFFMFLNLLIVVIQPISFIPSTSNTYFAVIYCKYFIKYGRSICEMVVIFSNVLSGFCCYIFIGNIKFNSIKVMKKKASLYLTLILICSSAMIFIYQLFEFEIEKLDNSRNSTIIWDIIPSKSHIYSYFGLISMLIRDGLGMFLLIAMNIILLFKVLPNF